MHTLYSRVLTFYLLSCKLSHLRNSTWNSEILSSRPDLLPEEVIRELEPTVDAVPPFPTSSAIKMIEEDIGASFTSAFEESALPIAAASLGQVYRVNYNGDELAVKVKRPDAQRLLASDIFLAPRDTWGC